MEAKILEVSLLDDRWALSVSPVGPQVVVDSVSPKEQVLNLARRRGT